MCLATTATVLDLSFDKRYAEVRPETPALSKLSVRALQKHFYVICRIVNEPYPITTMLVIVLLDADVEFIIFLSNVG